MDPRVREDDGGVAGLTIGVAGMTSGDSMLSCPTDRASMEPRVREDDGGGAGVTVEVRGRGDDDYRPWRSVV
jgi:hypothetical protein